MGAGARPGGRPRVSPGRCQEHPHPNPMDRRLRTGNTDPPSPHAQQTCTGGRLSGRVSVGWDKDQEGGHTGEPGRTDAEEGTAWNSGRTQTHSPPAVPQAPLFPGPASSHSGAPVRPTILQAGPAPTPPSLPIHTSAHTPSSLLPAARTRPPPDMRMDRWMHGWTE